MAENGRRPAVVSMSLGGSGSRIQDESVAALYNAGVSVVVSAGNDDDDACYKSPARAPHVSIVVWPNNNNPEPIGCEGNTHIRIQSVFLYPDCYTSSLMLSGR